MIIGTSNWVITLSQASLLEGHEQLLSQDPPDTAKALQALQEALNHAFRANYRESRPEVWLVAAAVELLNMP